MLDINDCIFNTYKLKYRFNDMRRETDLRESDVGNKRICFELCYIRTHRYTYAYIYINY